jgi:orotidine-5'-phosphate decarboxylase
MAELVVALDYPEAAPALDMARRLVGTAPWVKVGLELFTAEGPGLVADLKALGFRVFLDLKFLDIPNTVRGAVRSAARLGADMVNIHVLGGARMAEAALEGRDAGTAPGAEPPLLLGVTVLTSMADADLPVDYPGGAGALALELARRARGYYLDGVVCSGLEAARIKEACGAGFRCLTPGIRPTGGSDDQRRTVIPAQAVAAGADYLVVGRPVTQAPDPRSAAMDVLRDMRTGC